MDGSVQVGFPGEWRAFAEAHPEFIQCFPRLIGTFRKVFHRELSRPSTADVIVFGLNRLCREDFSEILLLAGNGHGIGAKKVLRGMYERTVSAMYVAKHPELAERFVEHHKMDLGRGLAHLRVIWTDEELEKRNVRVRELEADYNAVKEKFAPACKKCGAPRLETWSRRNLVEMAEEVSPPIRELYLECYFVPTLHAHPSLQGINERMMLAGSGFEFHPGPEREQASRALGLAHNLILFVLNNEIAYFDLPLAEDLEERSKEFHSIWVEKGSKFSEEAPKANARAQGVGDPNDFSPVQTLQVPKPTSEDLLKVYGESAGAQPIKAMQLDGTRTETCLHELELELLRIGTDHCNNLEHTTPLSAVVQLGVRAVSLLRSARVLLRTETLDGYDAQRRAFRETWSLQVEFRLRQSAPKVARWFADRTKHGEADLKIVATFIESLGHGRPPIGPEYGELSALAHPTADAAAQSVAVVTGVHGRSAARLDEALAHLMEDYTGLLASEVWLLDGTHADLIDLPVRRENLRECLAVFQEFRAEDGRP